MSNIDVFVMAIRNLLKRKMRTFLTILGVVIGTASVIVMVSLGLAMNQTFNSVVNQLGDITTVTVRKPDSDVYVGPGVTVRKKDAVLLDDNAIIKFKQLPGVVAASPIVETNLHFKSGKYINVYAQVYGLDPSAMAALGYEIADGSYIDPNLKYSMVFGSEFPYAMYNPNDYSSSRMYRSMRGMDSEESEEREPPKVDVLKDRLLFSYDFSLVFPDWETDAAIVPPKPVVVKAAGLLKPKGAQYDRAVYMSLAQVQKLKVEQAKYDKQRQQSYGYTSTSQNQNLPTGYDIAYVKCGDLNTVKKVHEQIVAMGYPAEIPTQQLESMKQVSESLQALLAAVGAVSLFVSALGIANTMVMSMYERTREIGIMKVIGALLSDIRKLFLLEAALIGFFGGLLGLGASLGISYFLNTSDVLSFMSSITSSQRSYYYYSEMPAATQSVVSLIPLWLCGGAMVFATGIGLVSGFFPANRAMNLSALTAIRTE